MKTHLKGLKPSPSKVLKNQLTFQEQLQLLQSFGFTFNEGISFSDIAWAEDLNLKYEEKSFFRLYLALGGTNHDTSYTHITNKCWVFDFEAICNKGDYARILKQLSRLSQGELGFEDLNDSIDIEKEIADVSFTCKGSKYKWYLEVNDDWADDALFYKVQALATQLKTKGKFTCLDTGGQDCVIGYHTKEELQKIRKATGLDIAWINPY
jgi:hypothetical protein